MTELLRRPAVVRVVLAVAWVGVALAFVHLAQGSTRPHRFDVHGALWAAALAAVAIGALVSFARGRRVMALSAAGAVVVAVATLGLIAANTAHETGFVLIALGLFIAAVSIFALRSEDVAQPDRLPDPAA